ncbi:tagaturonate epimerase family protein, partial [Chloroflexota bacterium]
MEKSFLLVEVADGPRLRVEGVAARGFHGEEVEPEVWLCPFTAANAAALRRVLPWTAPTTVGLRKSVGCGDRLGLATPGHIRAVLDGDMFPVFAQQSIREMVRSDRTPQDVIDDATWAVYAMDYRGGYGSDADHLKNTEVIDQGIAAGFVGFTLDPGDFVDNDAHTDDRETLQRKYQALPWDKLKTTPAELLESYLGPSIVGEADTVMVYRAACKYGAAILDATAMAQHISRRMGDQEYDLEISVDETETPTSPFEHYFIASELIRLGVTFHGLAPRFIGDFEKGVDYIGDLEAFEVDFARHARIAQKLGPYKLSIHSGSDKFSIYGIIAQHANPYVHLKTAGTSWLEAMRVIALREPNLMREMLAYALECYPEDRVSYHVSAEMAKVPVDLPDERLAELLDQFDARQVLHVTFGSLLAKYREPFYATLRANQDVYG